MSFAQGSLLVVKLRNHEVFGCTCFSQLSSRPLLLCGHSWCCHRCFLWIFLEFCLSALRRRVLNDRYSKWPIWLTQWSSLLSMNVPPYFFFSSSISISRWDICTVKCTELHFVIIIWVWVDFILNCLDRLCMMKYQSKHRVKLWEDFTVWKDGWFSFVDEICIIFLKRSSGHDLSVVKFTLLKCYLQNTTL